MLKTTQAKVITIQKLPQLRYPLPKSWTQAAGLLRHRKTDLYKHLKRVRLEWSRHNRTA